MKSHIGAIDQGTASTRFIVFDNLKTLDWDEKLLAAFEIPGISLSKVRSSSEVYGEARLGVIGGVPVAGILADQQAALAGHSSNGICTRRLPCRLPRK